MDQKKTDGWKWHNRNTSIREMVTVKVVCSEGYEQYHSREGLTKNKDCIDVFSPGTAAVVD